MDIIINIIWDGGKWVVGIGAAVLVIALLISVARYGMSAGNPQSAASARAAMVACLFGLVALPSVLVGYRLFYADVIAPNTGSDVAVFEVSCNRILQRQLQARPNVDTKGEVDQLIRAIQLQKQDCAKDAWSLTPLKSNASLCTTPSNGDVATFLPLDSNIPLKEAVGAEGIGRAPGYIVVVFAHGSSSGLTAANDCWGYSADLGQWVAG